MKQHSLKVLAVCAGLTFATGAFAAVGADQAAKLGKALEPYEVSGVVESKHGYHVILRMPIQGDDLVMSSDGSQAPENMEAIFPSPTASFHPSDHVVRLVAIKPSSIIFCQNSVKVLVPSSSVRLIVTFLPSLEVEIGRPPASLIIVS